MRIKEKTPEEKREKKQKTKNKNVMFTNNFISGVRVSSASGLSISSSSGISSSSSGSSVRMTVNGVSVHSEIGINSMDGRHIIIGSLKIPLTSARKSIRIVSLSEIYIDDVKADIEKLRKGVIDLTGGEVRPQMSFTFSGCTIGEIKIDTGTFTNCEFDSIETVSGSVTATGDVDSIRTVSGRVECRDIIGKAATVSGSIVHSGSRQTSALDRLLATRASKKRR